MDEIEERTTAMGLARYAEEFFRAAMAVDHAMGHEKGHEFTAPVPALFLTAHAIELTLKSYLRHQGISVKELEERFGHNLFKCLLGAIDMGLDSRFATHEGVEAVDALNELHMSTRLRYIQTGMTTIPIFGPLMKFTKDLQDEVCPIVGWRQKVEMFIG